MTGAEILALPMAANDIEAETVRDYLKALLDQLWSEGEGFSGKRPFGNSGWEYELYATLIKSGAIAGKIDEEYGHVEEISDIGKKKANQLIFDAIKAL